MKMRTLSALFLLSLVYTSNVFASENSATEAVAGEIGCVACGDYNGMEGKLEASAVMEMHISIANAEKKAKDLSAQSDLILIDLTDSNGLIQYFGQQEMLIQADIDEMKKIMKRSRTENNDSLFKSYSEIKKLSSEINSLYAEGMKKIKELGQENKH